MGALELGVGGSAGSEGSSDAQAQGFLEVRGKVTEATRSLIPNVTIYTVDCGNIKMKFDMHNKLLRFSPGEEVVITISKTAPTYDEGVDFVAWGYVISLKPGEALSKMIISLWGYIVIVETDRHSLLSGFNFMDKVYFKVAKPSTSVGT